MKPKLLALELWGLGDLVIASEFLRQAAEKFEVTLLSKSFALELRDRIHPAIRVVPFNAPWTAFTRKYYLPGWRWGELSSVVKQLRREQFDVAVSGRWDPRDHFLMALTGAKRRLGFPRLGSGIFLTETPTKPDPGAHHYEYWRLLGQNLGLEMPRRGELELSPRPAGRTVVVHTGAAQPVRVWSLERCEKMVRQMRAAQYEVRVLCNPDQRDWWLCAGETAVAAPATIRELMDLLADAGVFIGNDSGPGHLAAFLGIPTFTIFGPQLPGLFVPLHPGAVAIEGKPCPYKPCSDYCRFASPRCLDDLGEAEVWPQLEIFLKKQFPPAGN